MPAPDRDSLLTALKEVKYPGFSRDIVSFGIIKGITTADDLTTVHIELSTPDDSVVRTIEQSVETTLRKNFPEHSFRVDIKRNTPITASASTVIRGQHLPGVSHVIAVASGKGGVGKSTVAANIACALSIKGAKVGLCDCDLYGPSMSLMFGTREYPSVTDDNKIIPIHQYGIRLLSLAFLTDPDQPAVLRGPMVTRYTQQFLLGADWSGCDYLVLDLPPGTGDIQLTIVQSIALSGAIVVTTPQEVALIDARKAIAMFGKVNVPILGLIENMSYFHCPDTGKHYHIFGKGGGTAEAKKLGVPLLAEVPLDIAAREAGDHGRPIVVADKSNPVSRAFLEAAQKIIQSLPIPTGQPSALAS